VSFCAHGWELVFLWVRNSNRSLDPQMPIALGFENNSI
jgi:hypothetical protein